MAEVKESSILIQDVETKNIMTKSALPVGGYSVNPYVGCTHGCKYCYASFMKRFTGHTEPWGTFLDPDLVPLYDAIYNKRDRSYFRGLEDQAERLAKENSCPFVDNELPYGRAEPGHPVIVDYFYHEEVRGSENTGRRNPKK